MVFSSLLFMFIYLPVVLAIVAGVLVVGGIAFLVTRFGPSYVHETQKFDEEFDAIVDNHIDQLSTR